MMAAAFAAIGRRTAPDTCSDDLLREVKKLADARGGNVHTHLSQLPAEIEAVKARTG